MNQWCLSRKEMELHSPSRRDGISLTKESQLCSQYCSYIHQLGSKLRLPHLSIVKATMFCHRFYACQSLAKNDWHTVATACVFLAGKAEETPRHLGAVVDAAFGNQIYDQVMYQMIRSYVDLQDMREREKFSRKKGRVFREEKKALVVAAERLVLRTIGFDLEVQLPYKTLAIALERLREENITGFARLAKALVEELLTTSLCLQYRPQYIGAASVVVATSILKMKLPASDKWLEGLDVSPKELNELIQRLQRKISEQLLEPTGSLKQLDIAVTAASIDPSSPFSFQ